MSKRNKVEPESQEIGLHDAVWLQQTLNRMGFRVDIKPASRSLFFYVKVFMP